MADSLIEFAAGVTLEGKPFVHLIWGKEEGQLTPEEAIHHALEIIETAQGAVIDAFFMRFMRDKLGVPIDANSAVILREFREFREARVSRRAPPPPKPTRPDKMERGA